MTEITWKRISERAAAPHVDGERQPFTVCQIGPDGDCTWEAWATSSGRARQIACGLASRDEAMRIVEDKIRGVS